MIEIAAIIIWTLVAVLAVIFFTVLDDSFDTATHEKSSFDTPDLEAVRRAYEAVGEDATR